MAVACCVGFVGKAFSVLSFVEEAAVRVCGGDGDFFFFWWLIIVVKGFFVVFVTVFVDFCKKLFGVSFGLFGYGLLCFFLCIGTGFYMGAINEYRFCVEIALFGSRI